MTSCAAKSETPLPSGRRRAPSHTRTGPNNGGESCRALSRFLCWSLAGRAGNGVPQPSPLLVAVDVHREKKGSEKPLGATVGRDGGVGLPPPDGDDNHPVPAIAATARKERLNIGLERQQQAGMAVAAL